jgi:hypothetical protein
MKAISIAVNGGQNWTKMPISHSTLGTVCLKCLLTVRRRKKVPRVEKLCQQTKACGQQYPIHLWMGSLVPVEQIAADAVKGSSGMRKIQGDLRVIFAKPVMPEPPKEEEGRVGRKS